MGFADRKNKRPRLVDRSFAVVPPSEAGIQTMYEGKHGIERCRGRVKRKRLLLTNPRVASLFFTDGLAAVRHPLNPASPGLDIRGGRVMQPRLFTFRKFDLHLGCQDQSDLVLDSKNIVYGAIVTLGPEMRAVLCVDQLRRDPDAVAALANATLK